jgi:hypothetical protein
MSILKIPENTKNVPKIKIENSRNMYLPTLKYDSEFLEKRFT